MLAAGRKLVGLAQRRTRHGALVQCGLLLRWKPAPLLAALDADPHDPEVARAAVGLRELSDVGQAQVIDAVEARLSGAGTRLPPPSPMPEVV